MTTLFWRFFTYIWGAIIGTTLFVLLLIVWRDDPPSGLIPAGDVAPFLQAPLAAEMARGGAAGARAWLSAQPGFAASFRLMDAPCGAPNLGPDAAGLCLQLQTPPPKGLWRFVPFLVPLLSGMAIAMAAAWGLARRFLRPIDRIGGALTALAHGALQTRIGPSEEPALETLSQAFDQAALHLQELTESRTRLFHDISHELRSPLARLQAQTAILRQNPGRLGGLLPRLEQDISRMDRLIDQILTLARLEHGAEMKPEALDLVELIDPILADAALEAQALGKTVAYAGPERLALTGDAELLHRAVENILRNAIRHAPEGTAVVLRLGVGPGQGRVIEVQDAGPGVPPERLETIFQAFERDASGGTGLGLAIAARAVRLHGGTIHATTDTAGFAVTIRLPG